MSKEVFESRELKYRDVYRKRGRFSVSREMIFEYPHDLANLFDGMIIVDAQENPFSFEYVAMHPDFDMVPEGCVVPRYLIEFQRMADGSIIRSFRREKH